MTLPNFQCLKDKLDLTMSIPTDNREYWRKSWNGFNFELIEQKPRNLYPETIYYPKIYI